MFPLIERRFPFQDESFYFPIITVSFKMGNESIISDTGLKNAERVATLELTHVGTVTLLRLQEKQCFLKVLSFSDSFLMEQHLRKLKIRVSKFSGCPHVLNVYQVRKQERNELCTNNYQLHIYLQYFEETFAQTIEKHLEQRRNFTEDDLYSFLGKAVDSLIYIQDNGLKTIHLDANTMIFSGQQIKVLDSGVGCSKEYYRLLNEKQKNIRNQEHKIYLAPELLKDLKELNYDPYISPKADIFSLGMLLLEMVTLEPMRCYYDYHKATMDYDSLIHRLSRISHSLPLKTLLAEMLEQDPGVRIGLVSLKEKIQKLQNPIFGEQSMIRSRSSKMLKEILSNSRRSGSNSKQGEATSRNQSNERKHIQQKGSNCKNKQQQKRQSLKKDSLKGTCHSNMQKEAIKRENINQHMNNNVQHCQFKNLVKNRLIKDRNKQNPNKQSNCNTGQKSLKGPSRQMAIDSRTLREGSNCFEQSTRSNKYDSISSHKFECNDSKFESNTNNNKFESSLESNQFDTSIEVKSSLCKLVQESGLTNLLNLQKLNPINLNNYQQALKNTSRFGSFEAVDQSKKSSVVGITNNSRMSLGLNINVPFAKCNKPSQIFIKQQNQYSHTGDEREQHGPIMVRKSIEKERQFNKVMTFNNKQFGIYARSVEPSLDVEQDSVNKQQKLIFSPISSTERQQPNSSGYIESDLCSASESIESRVAKNIPVEVSQEKVCMTRAQSIKNNFGKIQRQLEINNCAQSIQKINMANYRSNTNNAPTVRQSCKFNQSTRQDNEKANINSNFFKKIKGKKPQLNIQLQEQQNQKIVDGSIQYSEIKQLYGNCNSAAQMQPSLKSMLDVMSKTSRSIQQEQLSNFASISPPRENQINKNTNLTSNISAQGKNQQTINNIPKDNVKKIVLSNGDIYEGELNNEGQMHGNGIIYSQGKVRYNGYFKNDKFNGNGTLYNLTHFPLPVDYHYIDLGRLYWTKYEGDFQNGLKNGFAKIYFSSGDRFTGSLKKDIIQGYGCFYSKSGQPITGQWTQNRFKAL